MRSRADFHQAPLREVDYSNYEFSDNRCFPGAWYYKVKSPIAPWLGMEALVTLPVFHPDEERFEFLPDKRFENGQMKRYLDTPSVYLGGVSEHECDIGFGWFHGLLDGKISPEKIAFRPFWRTIHVESGKEVNRYLGTAIEQSEYYYFPGDQVKICLFCEKEDHLTFTIDLVKPTTLAKYVSIRSRLNQPASLVVPDLIAPGNGHHLTENKRVNAIDQYHNEGKPTHLTKAQVDACIWQDVYLFYEHQNQMFKTPFEGKNQTTMMCPSWNAFELTKNEQVEVIAIRPNQK